MHSFVVEINYRARSDIAILPTLQPVYVHAIAAICFILLLLDR